MNGPYQADEHNDWADHGNEKDDTDIDDNDEAS